MLGQFNLLPMLKGWEYKVHLLEKSDVVRGAAPKELRISEMGWLMTVLMISTDSYGTLRVTWQGADLQAQEFSGNAEAALAFGAVAQDPAGWVQRYYRPNPDSTAGIFVSILFSGGAQGSVWPFVPTVVMEISLSENSTQASAYILAVAVTIVITNPELFKRTLQEITGANAEIAKKLLALLQRLEEKKL